MYLWTVSWGSSISQLCHVMRTLSFTFLGREIASWWHLVMPSTPLVIYPEHTDLACQLLKVHCDILKHWGFQKILISKSCIILVDESKYFVGSFKSSIIGKECDALASFFKLLISTRSLHCRIASSLLLFSAPLWWRVKFPNHQNMVETKMIHDKKKVINMEKTKSPSSFSFFHMLTLPLHGRS